jgi:ABC-type transport system substrate-binding protein/class 3 adenylate cyclase
MSVSAGERRIVSVLVADVADSTSIAEQLGPERSKFLFDEVVRLLREEVERFGGTIAQLTGDGVLAVFGAPVAHDDDSERAVRSALAIQEALDSYAADIAPAYGVDLRARVAVNTGPVVIPSGEAPPDVLYNALGDTVNVAARLQTLGDLIVGAATARHVGHVVDLEELGDVELKGRAEPVTAFRVTGMRAATVVQPETPLVGRHAELAVLVDILDGLVGGEGAVVSITGEPGIGKSRLIGEVEARFADRVGFLSGHAVAYAETIAYWPVRELLRGWLDLSVSDPEARARLELRAELARSLGDESDEAYPFIASLLGLALEAEQEQRLRNYARDAVQRQTYDWLYQLLVTLARERPLCLVLDDLHWSDEATLSLLEELLPAAEQTAVAFVLIHRSDPDHPAWQLVDGARRRFRRQFRDIELEALPDSDAHALAEVTAGGRLPGELAQLLTEQAGGNPYFVGEAVRDLLERGALGRKNGRLVLVGEASMPAALRETLQARLDRLGPDARDIITTASVIGRSFGLPLLEQLLPQARLQPTLSELQWLGLVVEERGGTAPEYRFRHGLVQEVAYDTLVEARRQELHRAVGEALVHLHRDSPAEVYGLLGRHFAEADEPGRAVEYLLKAADAARAVYANQEGVELYRKALGFMERTGDDERARETLLKIALTHHLAFDFHRANAAFGEAFARRVPAPVRRAPTERITWALAAAGLTATAPGHGYSPQSWEITRNLFRGLVATGRDFEVECDLAESFTVSDDGRVYRFTLEPEARWSDGMPVTADDFAFTYAQMTEDEVVTASWLEGVSAAALDERTLEIRLHEPRNYVLYQLGQPPFFAWPRHAYEQDGPDWHRAVPLVGNGPFVLTARDADQAVIAAAPGWRGARGNVAQVTVAVEPSSAVAADRWRSGDYDITDEVILRDIDAKETVVERSPGGFSWYLGFNARRKPLDDARVRRALAHSIDRRAPAELLRSAPAQAGGLRPPTMPGHSHRVAPGFDPDCARRLLAEAGYPEPEALGELVVVGLELWEDAVSEVAAQFNRIGVHARVAAAATDGELEAMIDERAHAFIWAWATDYPDPGGGILETAVRYLRWVYRDERLGALLARAATLQDQDERLGLYRTFERLWIGEESALVPLAYEDRKLFRRPWVTGVWCNAVRMSTFADAVVTRPPAGA